MIIRHIEGLHLTATNKRHMADILAKGWQSGATARLAYQLQPIAGNARQYAYTITKKELDDYGRPMTRQSRGIIEAGGAA